MTEPAGLSRLRLPFRHPGLGRQVTARRADVVIYLREIDVHRSDGVPQSGPGQTSRQWIETVRGEDAIDHVCRNVSFVPPTNLDRYDRARTSSPDRPCRAGNPRRTPKRRHCKPRLPALGSQEPRHRRKSRRRHSVHHPTIPRGCDHQNCSSGRHPRPARSPWARYLAARSARDRVQDPRDFDTRRTPKVPLFKRSNSGVFGAFLSAQIGGG